MLSHSTGEADHLTEETEFGARTSRQQICRVLEKEKTIRGLKIESVMEEVLSITSCKVWSHGFLCYHLFLNVPFSQYKQSGIYNSLCAANI